MIRSWSRLLENPILPLHSFSFSCALFLSHALSLPLSCSLSLSLSYPLSCPSAFLHRMTQHKGPHQIWSLKLEFTAFVRSKLPSLWYSITAAQKGLRQPPKPPYNLPCLQSCLRLFSARLISHLDPSHDLLWVSLTPGAFSSSIQ